MFLLPHHWLEPASRLTLAALLLCVGVFLALDVTLWAFPFFVLTLFLVWDYFRTSSVWLAFREFRRGYLVSVERLLGKVYWPQLLSRQALAYYHWLKGVVESAAGRPAAAQVHLLVAAAGRLKTENDRALVQCLLAETAIVLGDEARASGYLDLAAKLTEHPGIHRMVARLRTRMDSGGG